MRPIKFRAWVAKSKKMIYPDSLMFNGEGEFSIGFQHYNRKARANTVWSGRGVLMQFTGMTDNSKEENDIYEGDILHGGGLLYAVVVFEEGRYGVDSGDKFYTLKMYLNSYPSRVVGNIYQNPNLISDAQRR